jgi:hypothetical protein
MHLKRYLKFANTPPLEQVAGTGLLNAPTFIGIFLFFLAFALQWVYLPWVILHSTSVFAAHFIQIFFSNQFKIDLTISYNFKISYNAKTF